MMTQVLLTALLCIVGAALGGWLSSRWARFARRAKEQRIETLTRRAEQGAAADDPERAEWKLGSLQPRPTGIQMRVLSLINIGAGALCGAVTGLLVAQWLGLYGEGA